MKHTYNLEGLYIGMRGAFVHMTMCLCMPVITQTTTFDYNLVGIFLVRYVVHQHVNYKPAVRDIKYIYLLS